MTDLQRSEYGVSVNVDSRNRVFSFILRDPHQLVDDLLWQSLLLLLNKIKNETNNKLENPKYWF